MLEKTVLSGIIQHGPNGIAEVDDVISTDSFANLAHQKLYFVLHNLIYKDKCEHIDIPTIIVAANALGLAEYTEVSLKELSDKSMDLKNLRRHAFGLFKLKFARELMDKLNEATIELAQCSSDTKLSKISSIIEDKLFGSIASLDSEIGTCNILKEAKEYLDHAWNY
jgi:replicative DNA helicase